VLARNARAAAGRFFTPPARLLLRLHVSPDAVTFAGTVGVVAAALWFYPRGELLWGTLVIVLFVFSDTLDGTMARLSGRPSTWGAFLDSTLDRVSDAAVFVGLALWFAGEGDELALVWASLVCLVGGLLVSYTRARAEGLGLDGSVGLAERTERLIAVLAAAGLAGMGVPYVLAVVLWLLAAATWFTVGQRMLHVRRQALAG
jgi:CDP-diacylglycerol--glycerol-3-phosphate 3-phosphatidyltransferase